MLLLARYARSAATINLYINTNSSLQSMAELDEISRVQSYFRPIFF